MMGRLRRRNIAFISSHRLREAVALIFACLIAGYLFASCGGGNSKEELKETVAPAISDAAKIEAEMANAMTGMDFSIFKHDSPQHQKLTCLICHERSPESSKPKLPGHSPCASCHIQQFEDKSNAICTICHTQHDSADVKEFPQLRSFNSAFDHQAHFKETNCASCHNPEGGGGMAVPSGADAHASCFQCHTPDKMAGDKNIGSCATCHQPGDPVRIKDSTKTIGFGFDHKNHSNLDCQSCHNPLGGNKMSAIKTAMHSGQSDSCATCHNESRAFGANDFSDCRKCHQEFADAKQFGVSFSHSPHAKANCASCHKPLGKGTGFSIPSGQNAHNTCFQCHSPTKKGTNLNNGYCFSCHQPGKQGKFAMAGREVAGNFSHSKHKAMNCSACHSIAGGGISAPSAAMHKAAKGRQSCASCHNNQRAFGGDDFANCKLCHTGNNFKF